MRLLIDTMLPFFRSEIQIWRLELQQPLWDHLGKAKTIAATLVLLLLLLSHFSRVRLCATPETAAHQGPPSLGFSRQEHWSGLPFPSPMHESEKWKWSCSVLSNSLWPHGLQPIRLLRSWDFPGKSTGVGCHCFLQTLALAPLNFWINTSNWTGSLLWIFQHIRKKSNVFKPMLNYVFCYL